MLVLNLLRKMIGSIKVTQTETEIIVQGVGARTMESDINRVWRTSRIMRHMFTDVSRYSFSIPLFFAPDLIYILQRVMAEPKEFTDVRSLSAIIELLYSNTWLQGTQLDPKPRIKYSRINRLIYKPIDFQADFIKQYDRLTQQYNLKGYMLAATAGSGKTYITLALAEVLNVNKLIIIAPKNAVYRVWEAEVKKLFKREQSYWIVADGERYNKERIIIAHYEVLDKVLRIAKKLRSKQTMIVLDESHNLNGETSQRTNRFLELVEETQATDTIWASGTPIKSLGTELIPFLRSVDPLFTQDVESRFKRIYGSSTGHGNEILETRMGIMSFKVEKHQLGLEVPLIKRLLVTVPTGELYTLNAVRADMRQFISERAQYYAKRRPEDLMLYNEAVSQYEATLSEMSEMLALERYRTSVVRIQQAGGDARRVGELIKESNRFEREMIEPVLSPADKKVFRKVKSLIKYTNLVLVGEALGRVIGRKRIECHMAMVPHIDFKAICGSSTKKTIMFTSFVEALQRAESHLESIKMQPLAVYGSTNKNLSKIIDSFEKDYDANPLLATYQSLSTAVPLVMADTMIMLNAPFRAYIREQAISRINRLGADTQATVYETFLDTGDEPNLSTRAGDILQWSQDQVESIMGIKSPFEIGDTAEGITVASESIDVDLSQPYSEILETHFPLADYLKW